MPEELKLLPCPVCSKPRMQGGKAVFLCQLDRAWDCGGWWYRAICADCGKRGRAGCSGEEAVKHWNDGVYEEDLPRALTWTTEPPRAEGWYWVRSLCPVSQVPSPATVFMYAVGMDIQPEFKVQYAGPIPMPKEPIL